jgi:hypothetical protein
LGWTKNFAKAQTYPPTLGQVQAEIDDDRPISVNLDWNDGSSVGHNVVIVGYDVTDPANPTIDLGDPESGVALGIDLKQFPANYGGPGGATWTGTFFTKSNP